MPEEGVEPSRGKAPPDFESGASSNSTTPANVIITVRGGFVNNEIWISGIDFPWAKWGH